MYNVSMCRFCCQWSTHLEIHGPDLARTLQSLLRLVLRSRELINCEMKMELSWWLFLYGFYLMAVDFCLQFIRCAHLPKRLPLRLSPQLTVIVTGATSGIGFEIAGELARAGAHVVLAVRDTAAGGKLVEEWTRVQKLVGGPSINAEVVELNLLSLASVRDFAKQWNDRQVPLHVLVNNAGIFSMFVKQRFSEDGNEYHMQVNHLGHALLSMLLLPSLIRGAPARIINVNSEVIQGSVGHLEMTISAGRIQMSRKVDALMARKTNAHQTLKFPDLLAMHHMGFVDPEDMNFMKRKFSSFAGYCASKLAQVLFSRIFHMRIVEEAGVDVILLHPGDVMTNISRDLPPIVRKAEKIVTGGIRFTPIEGARSALFCATDLQVYQSVRSLREMGCPVAPYFSSSCRPAKVARLADDVEYAEKVYDKTLHLVGVPRDYVETTMCNIKIFPPRK